ncbi:MAG: RNase adapter RapZ [Myxococcales bacterium]|nr:RNase adapter RapZ [Myxococcales bacterium]
MSSRSRVVVVTGISGSGRSTCLRALEDLGYYCVDNLPASLLAALVDTISQRLIAAPVAVGIDIRAGNLLGDLDLALQTLGRTGVTPDLLFVDCADDVLVRRFAETRRKHPVWQAGTITEAIRVERATMLEVRERTTLHIDTSEMNVHQLKRQVQRLFEPENSGELRLVVAVESFGFKYGIPRDADYVFDVRFVDNPYFVPELQPLSGKDRAVADYVLSRGGAQALERIAHLLELSLPLHAQEGRALVTLAIGCTGGQHRSVAIAEALAAHVAELKLGRVQVNHRNAKLASESAA